MKTRWSTVVESFGTLFALRSLRIGTRLAVGFSLVVGMLLALFAFVAVYAKVQRDLLSGSIQAVTAADAAVATLKSVGEDRAVLLRELQGRPDAQSLFAEGGEWGRVAAEYGQSLKALQGPGLDPQAREIVARLVATEEELATMTREVRSGGSTSLFQNRAADAMRRSTNDLDRLTVRLKEGYKGAVDAFVERGERATYVTVVGAAAVLVLVVVIAVGITQGVTAPLRAAVQVARNVASGDLTARIEAHGRDEAAELLRAMGEMNEQLARMVSDIRLAARSIAGDADEVAQGNEQLASRTEQQASSLEETASTLEEFTSTVKQSAGHAGEASTHATDAASIANDGGAAVQAVVDKMRVIGESSKKIREVVSVIDAIAFQTNILALNAAVEAARAGDQGRGFAVVASEVRALAQRSAASAKDISAMIGSSVSEIAASTTLAGKAGDTIHELVVAVQRVSALMDEVASASREQSSGIEQINKAVTQMDTVVQTNAALVSRAADAAQSLRQQAAALLAGVERFTLPGESGSGAPAATALAVAPAARGSGLALPRHLA